MGEYRLIKIECEKRKELIGKMVEKLDIPEREKIAIMKEIIIGLGYLIGQEDW